MCAEPSQHSLRPYDAVTAHRTQRNFALLPQERIFPAPLYLHALDLSILLSFLLFVLYLQNKKVYLQILIDYKYP